MSYFREGLGLVFSAATRTPIRTTSAPIFGAQPTPRLSFSTTLRTPLPTPTRTVVPSYQAPLRTTLPVAPTVGGERVVRTVPPVVEHPGAGTTYAGTVPGSPPPPQAYEPPPFPGNTGVVGPTVVNQVPWSASWTPSGPTLSTAQAKADAAAAARDTMNEAEISMTMVPKTNYLLYGGIAAAVLVGGYFLWKRYK